MRLTNASPLPGFFGSPNMASRSARPVYAASKRFITSTLANTRSSNWRDSTGSTVSISATRSPMFSMVYLTGPAFAACAATAPRTVASAFACGAVWPVASFTAATLALSICLTHASTLGAGFSDGVALITDHALRSWVAILAKKFPTTPTTGRLPASDRAMLSANHSWNACASSLNTRSTPLTTRRR